MLSWADQLFSLPEAQDPGTGVGVLRAHLQGGLYTQQRSEATSLWPRQAALWPQTALELLDNILSHSQDSGKRPSPPRLTG